MLSRRGRLSVAIVAAVLAAAARISCASCAAALPRESPGSEPDMCCDARTSFISVLLCCVVDHNLSLYCHCVHESRSMAGTRLCGAPKPSLPTTSRPTLTPQARRTFQESFDSFEKTVQRYSRTDDREFSNTTLRDVRDAAKEVERQLAARQCMRNMKRLEPFLNGLEAYSKVIEVLCNGTPFLSWIWVSCDIKLSSMDCVDS